MAQDTSRDLCNGTCRGAMGCAASVPRPKDCIVDQEQGIDIEHLSFALEDV